MITSVGYIPSEPLKMDPELDPFGHASHQALSSSSNAPGTEETDFLPLDLQGHHPSHPLPHHAAGAALQSHHPQQQQQQQSYAHQYHGYAPQQHPHQQLYSHSQHPQWGGHYMNYGAYHPMPQAAAAAQHHLDSSAASYGNNYYHASATAYPPPSALPGGPSPAGSHNTPSPTAHSEDGEAGDQARAPKRDYTPLMSGNNSGSSYAPPSMPAAKKAKVPKRKKKRDPNEPQKPVSAYALFFRDSQANIKAANPNAAFGDVSKIVASLWDGLDPENKAAYKKRTENAKKEYLKKLAAYRASLVSKGSSGGSPINEGTPYSTAPYGGTGPAPYGSSPYGGEMKPSPGDVGAGGYPYNNPSQQPQQQQLPPRQPSYGAPQGYMHPSQQMSNGAYGHHHPSGPTPPQHIPGSVPPVPPSSSSSSNQIHHPDNNNHRTPSSSSPPIGNSPHDPPSSSRGGHHHLDPTTGHLIERRSSSTSSSLCARPGCNNPISDNSSWGGEQQTCSVECGNHLRDYAAWGGPPAQTNGGTPGQQQPSVGPPPSSSSSSNNHQ